MAPRFVRDMAVVPATTWPLATPPIMRIALFGGSFDPPHRGHLAIAAAAAARFELDQVLFAPAGRQPLKQEGAAAGFAQRLAMVTLACTEDPRFAASALDAPHPDGSPNYSIDTLHRLAETHPDATLFNLAGADSFQTLAQWRNPQALLAAAEWIVVSRPGYESGRQMKDPPGLHLTPAQRLRIHLLNSMHEQATATGLRDRLAHGDPCHDLLPAQVSAYIEANALYSFAGAAGSSAADARRPL